MSDERGLNFDRNAAILLKSHFLNLMNMKTHFWLLLVLRYIKVACSAWHCHIIFIFTQTIEQTIVMQCLYVRFPGFFFLFFFYYVVCKQVERLPLLVIKTMTLKSHTNIQINRQQDARWRKQFVCARLITLVSQSKHGGKRS